MSITDNIKKFFNVVPENSTSTSERIKNSIREAIQTAIEYSNNHPNIKSSLTLDMIKSYINVSLKELFNIRSWNITINSPVINRSDVVVGIVFIEGELMEEMLYRKKQFHCLLSHYGDKIVCDNGVVVFEEDV